MTADRKDNTRARSLGDAVRDRILVLDGAMGTMIQDLALDEEDYRGDRFANHSRDLKGNHDILTLTRPDAVEKIHRTYLEAGADTVYPIGLTDESAISTLGMLIALQPGEPGHWRDRGVLRPRNEPGGDRGALKPAGGPPNPRPPHGLFLSRCARFGPCLRLRGVRCSRGTALVKTL
jgi:hypothetical protein